MDASPIQTMGHPPINAISVALQQHGLSVKDIDSVCVSAVKHPDIFRRIELYFQHYFGHSPKIVGVHHQEAHLASAFYPSGFEESIIVSFDGWGDFFWGIMPTCWQATNLDI